MSNNIDILKGKFITFEGVEGAGKSTQSKIFVDYLNDNGIKAEWTREPGGCNSAEEIRKLLLTGDVNKWDGITELLLMYASRRMHTIQKIQPLLQQNITVVSDRYFDSSLAYQGFGHQLPIEKIETIRKVVLDDFKPDLTIILDLPIEEGLARAVHRGKLDRFEKMTIDFHNRVKEGFDYIYKTEKNRCIKINVSCLSTDDLTSTIIGSAVEFFNRK